jgi:hypothetical protein
MTTTHQIVLAGFVAVVALGIGVFAGRWIRKRPFRYRYSRSILISLIVLGICGFLTSSCGIIWDGGFPTNEFELTFQNEDGKPVRGVELRVEDRKGRVYYHYPVTDFLPGESPTSDENGKVIFHHLGYLLEFDGYDWYLFGAIPIKEGPPIYVCRFLYQGHEVYRVQYDELSRLARNWEQLPTNKRQWNPPKWPLSEMAKKPGETSEQAHERYRALFYEDNEGGLDREGAAAYHAAMWESHDQIRAEKNSEDRPKEIEFPVVKKTITIR